MKTIAEADSGKQTKNKPTDEQVQALLVFAAANGRTWKADLRHCWESGCYQHYPGTKRCDLLQQIRNSFGPSWLVRFSLKEAKEWFASEFPQLLDDLNYGPEGKP